MEADEEAAGLVDDETGTGVVVIAPVVVAAALGMVAPARIFTVESSRSAVVLPVGSVPVQDGEGSTARVRWSLCKMDGGGMMSWLSPDDEDDRGRKDARSDNESRMAWADGRHQKR